ncbi:hypothetical protein AVEN_264446-1, partial [Araneus ventricosus]
SPRFYAAYPIIPKHRLGRRNVARYEWNRPVFTQPSPLSPSTGPFPHRGQPSRSHSLPGRFAASTLFAQHCPCHLAASRLSATTFVSFKCCMKIGGTDRKTMVDFIFFVDNRFL